MKKTILFATLLALATPTLFTSCSDDESEGKSRITTYAVLEMNGDEFIKLNVGDAFEDPGCVATMGTEDVTSQIKVTTDLDTSKPGYYTVKYTVYNPDGFPASTSRDVMVVDVHNFASAYFGESQYGSRHYFDAPITITKRSDGTYLIDDILGGFYCYGRYPGYEPTYDFHCEALVTLNADNTISLLATGDWYFSKYPVTITSGTFDPTSGDVELNLDFDGDPFYVKLTK